jgi:hypothetical protein
LSKIATPDDQRAVLASGLGEYELQIFASLLHIGREPGFELAHHVLA